VVPGGAGDDVFELVECVAEGVLGGQVLTVADPADDGFVEDADRFRCFFGTVTAWSAG
jgi:hypothetical protein